MNGEGDAELSAGHSQHVQVTFITKEKELDDIPESVFDIPTTADCENLNQLVNKTIQAVKDDWIERRFEFLVGETFVRTSLAEFIEEYNVETETVIKVECILGLEAPKPLHDLPAPDWVSSVHILQNNILSTTYNGEAIIWDDQGKQVLSVLRDKNHAYKCSSIIRTPKNNKSLDGLEFVVAGESQILTVLRVENGAAVPKIVFRGHERSVECVTVNADATRLVSGSFDNHIKVWNLQDDDKTTVFEKENVEKPKKRKEEFVTKIPMVTLGGHRDAVVGICWTPWSAGKVISASWDHSIVQWDLELAGEVSRIRGQKAFTSIDVNSKSGLVIAGSTDAVPRLYDPRSNEGVMVKQSFVGHLHSGWVSAVKWNPDDERCFVSSSYDNNVKMWDIRSSKTSLFDLHGHEDRVLCAAWAHGKIASGSADATVKVFQT